MYSTKLLKSFVLASCFLVFSFVKDARAGDVEFYITDTISSNGHKICWICTGPFFRSSGLHYFTAPFTGQHFYTTSDGIGSQYGEWNCYYNYANDLGGELLCLGPRAAFTYQFSFTLDKDAVKVEFVETPPGYDPRQTITRAVTANEVSAEAEAPEEISHAAALGDDARTDKSDRDTFTFDAVEGDDIVLKVVRDPAKGHIGSQARLKLRRLGAGSGEEVAEGSVPLRLKTTLPETGTYEVVVEQDDKQKDDWFRGDYFLVLRPGIAELVPAEDVEH
jgi:hypothetical protein